MASLPTDFSVTKTRRCPIPNPEPNVPNPSAVPAQPEGSVDAPDLINSESQANLPTPSAATPVEGTPTTPPFPLNHARFQYDNKLFGYSAITATTGTNPEYTVNPVTGLRWQFDNAAEIEIDLPSSVPMDTVCIGAHNLSGQNFTVDVEYDPSGGGTFTPFGSTVTPTTNNAIMIHLNGVVPVTTLKIIITGTGVFKYIGYISGGIALQMQRPFFNGYTPMTDERFTEFYTSMSETYNVLGRDVRRRGQDNSPSWNNLSDTWYRTYLEPIKDTLEQFPFFFAWNLLEYPNDVGLMRLTAPFSAPMQNGSMIRRDLSMSMMGTI